MDSFINQAIFIFLFCLFTFIYILGFFIPLFFLFFLLTLQLYKEKYKNGGILISLLSLQFAFYIERWFYPLRWVIYVIWAVVALAFLLEFARGNAERDSHLYCSHHQTLHLFGLVRLHYFLILLFLGVLGLADVGLGVRVVLEAFCPGVEGLLFAKGQFGVHLLDLVLYCVVYVAVLYWGWRRLLLFLQIYDLSLLPQFPPWLFADVCFIVSRTRNIDFLLSIKNSPFLLGENICCLLSQKCFMQLIRNPKISSVFPWSRIIIIRLKDSLPIDSLIIILILLYRNLPNRIHRQGFVSRIELIEVHSRSSIIILTLSIESRCF